MDSELFSAKIRSDYTRSFGVADIVTLTAEQANTLVDKLLVDVAKIDQQRAERKARGSADSLWLTKSGVAKHYRINMIRLVREHRTALELKDGFADSRCRALYHACDALVSILEDLEDNGTTFAPDVLKDITNARAILDDVEPSVDLASHRCGELRSLYKYKDDEITVSAEVAEEHADH